MLVIYNSRPTKLIVKKDLKKSEIVMEVGVSHGRKIIIGKSSQNSHIITTNQLVLICWGSKPFFVYVIKSCYDLSVLYVSEVGFYKKNWIGEWVSGLSIFWGDFLNFFNFATPLTDLRRRPTETSSTL